jgi:hypothetical protein
MTKYRKKPVVVEATQWLRYGDVAIVKRLDNFGQLGDDCLE